MARKNNYLFTDNEWSVDDIERVWNKIDEIGKKVFKLDYYEPKFELVTFDQMIDRYCTHGLPALYNHWSFGKKQIDISEHYFTGRENLAYEMIINTNPSITYLMENNTLTMQALVLAHAAVGHSSFYKNNYLFREYSNPNTILGFVNKVKNYISECESKYGLTAVESLIDAYHSLEDWAYDPRLDGVKTKKQLEQKRKKRIEYVEQNENYEFKCISSEINNQEKINRKLLNLEDNSKYKETSNIIDYICKFSTYLKDWEITLLQYLHEISMYFFPNLHTKIMNEGWASMMHYLIMSHLYDNKLITEGSYIEFIASHCSVVSSIDHIKPNQYYNPYDVGFNIFMDIKRICENPTDEDKEWFPDLIGADWLETVKDIVANYRDDSFIQQFLSPHLMRKMKLFQVKAYEDLEEYVVEYIHNDEGYYQMRNNLANQLSFNYRRPTITVKQAVPPLSNSLNHDMGRLLIYFTSKEGEELVHESNKLILKRIRRLWGPNTIKLYEKYPDKKIYYTTLRKDGTFNDESEE